MDWHNLVCSIVPADVARDFIGVRGIYFDKYLYPQTVIFTNLHVTATDNSILRCH